MANAYVPHCAPAEAKAKELCKCMKTLLERYETITRYVSERFAYDYVRAINVPKRNGKPNVARCWNLRMGICLDIAAITVGMLRAVSVPSNLVIGLANGNYHAWVESRIDGKRYLYDHDAKDKATIYKKERMY
jgi:transglutaminase-like putative cysteine protease